MIRRLTSTTANDPGIIHVRKSSYGQTLSETEERLPVRVFDCEPARVRIGSSVTRKLHPDGFEFVKVEASIELPCLPHPTDIEETIRYATNLVDELVSGSGDDIEAYIAPSHVRRVPGTPIA